MENKEEETQVELWNDMENMENMEGKYYFFYKTINTACNLFHIKSYLPYFSVKPPHTG
jgi:hypothetical protein